MPRRDPSVDVSVLTAVLNEEAVIHATASAITSQRFEGAVEFLFLDGDSNDRTRAILEELSRGDDRIRVLHNLAGDQASGLNLGLRNARGEFVVQMDAHTHYPADYVARGVERLRQGDVDWVTGPQIPHGTERWSRRVALALTSPLGFGGSRKWVTDASAEFELDTGVFCGVWRRSTLERHGGWDEGWPINHDSELAARVLAAGGRIVCLPTLGARYVPRNGLRALARQYRRYGYYRAKTSRAHPHSLRASALLPPALVLALLGAALATPVRRPARLALLAYGLGLIAASAREAHPGARADAVMLPAVFVTMHAAWGAGFLAGCLRFGPPLGAISLLMRGRRSSPGPRGAAQERTEE